MTTLAGIAPLLLIIVAAATSFVLRGARCPGGPIVAGIVAGLVLGPAFFGRLAPDSYERTFVGGADERINRDALDAARLTTAHEGSAAAWEAWEAATWAALLPGGLAYVLLTKAWGMSGAEALLAAAVVAIGPAALTAVDRQSADDAEHGGAHMLQRAGRIAIMLGVHTMVAGLAWADRREVFLPMLVLFALPLGWLLPIAKTPAWIRAIRDSVALPGMAACAMIGVEPFLDARLWLTVVLVIVAGDGRWLGALAGGAARRAHPRRPAGPAQHASRHGLDGLRRDDVRDARSARAVARDGSSADPRPCRRGGVRGSQCSPAARHGRARRAYGNGAG